MANCIADTENQEYLNMKVIDTVKLVFSKHFSKYLSKSFALQNLLPEKCYHSHSFLFLNISRDEIFRYN